MDKLAMEEAGFSNCISVPNGAPASVSNKNLPSEDQVCVFYDLSISPRLENSPFSRVLFVFMDWVDPKLEMMSLI